MHAIVAASFGHNLEQVIYETAKLLFYPVLLATVACLIWVLIELGYFFYETYLRLRSRDLEALEIRTLKARDAFDRGQPRRAYRYLQENDYSVVVARFLFDLIRNYQTERLAEKPLKLLQDYEFYTIKRLEKTRILVRLGPMLGLMGTLIPLAPALQALADGDTQKLADNLTIAFSITVMGLLIGGIAFMISIIRDRYYSQDISDLEYMLELLEGRGGKLRVGKPRRRKVDIEEVYDEDLPDDDEVVEAVEVVEVDEETAVEAVDAVEPAVADKTTGETSVDGQAAGAGAGQSFERPAPFVPAGDAPNPAPPSPAESPDAITSQIPLPGTESPGQPDEPVTPPPATV